MFYIRKMCIFCIEIYIYSTSVRFDLVKSPEVTLCG